MAFAAQALFQHMSPHHHLASATKKLYSKVVNYVMDGGGPVWAQSAHSCDLDKIVDNKHPRRAKYQTSTSTSTSISTSTST